MAHMTPQQVAELIHSRRTIHDFQAALPPREIMERAITLACDAPNHKLTAPWRFTFLGRACVEKLTDLNTALAAEQRGAEFAAEKRRRWLAVPGWLLVTSVKAADPIQAQEDYAACCCAIQNLMLYLWSAGIGVKWNTGKISRLPDFYRVVEIDPAQETVVGFLWYGYPASIPNMTRPSANAYIRDRR